jgi:hypothetical protein
MGCKKFSCLGYVHTVFSILNTIALKVLGCAQPYVWHFLILFSIWFANFFIYIADFNHFSLVFDSVVNGLTMSFASIRHPFVRLLWLFFVCRNVVTAQCNLLINNTAKFDNFST